MKKKKKKVSINSKKKDKEDIENKNYSDRELRKLYKYLVKNNIGVEDELRR